MEKISHEKRVTDLKKIGRTPLVIGERIESEHKHENPPELKEKGKECYYPTSHINKSENVFIYGQSGSGKTWMASNLMGQSFFNEDRSWVIICNTQMYYDNHLPNEDCVEELLKLGLEPRGIPKDQMVVIEPEYYKKYYDDFHWKDSQIMKTYRIPVRFLSIPLIFELTKVPIGQSYSTLYESSWWKMMKTTNHRPHLEDVYRVLRDIASNTHNNNTIRLYELLIDRLQSMEELLCDDDYSPMGKSLLSAMEDKKPRWIVMTLEKSQNHDDPINAAIYSTILEEIKHIMTTIKRKKSDLKMGFYLDKMQFYTYDTTNSSYRYTMEAIYNWFKRFGIMGIWSTQRSEHLPHLLEDNINNIKFGEGTYQKIFNTYYTDQCHCSFLDRSRFNLHTMNYSYFANRIKSAPPMFQIRE